MQAKTTLSDLVEQHINPSDFLGEIPDLNLENYKTWADALQSVDHLSDLELGIVIRDTLSNEYRYIVSGRKNAWLEYHTEQDRIYLTQTDSLEETLELYGGEQVIIPVKYMPHWSDDKAEPADIFAPSA